MTALERKGQDGNAAAEQIIGPTKNAGVTPLLADAASRIGTPLLQRKLAARVARKATNDASLVQRQPAPGTAATQTPPGRGLCTRFGDYWIVPDDTRQCYNVQGEQITESAFAKLQGAWDALIGGTGKVLIQEADSAGTAHAGFRDATLQRLGMLMSHAHGRRLVCDLVNGSTQVTIRPTTGRLYAGGQTTRGAGSLENADGTAGAGGTSTIEIDPSVTDNDVKVKDAAGKEIADPVFIFLGHEMIHARHNAAGRNRRGLAATDSAYPNQEEQQTIETGTDITEADLRRENGLPARHGHGATDARYP